MQSQTDLNLAFRVLETIGNHAIVKQRDAFALRIWAAQRKRMQSLEDIASGIIELARNEIFENESGYYTSEGQFLENEA
jgi:hypothetical protein